MTVKQLTIFASNEPGQLAKVTSALAAAGINIRGLCVNDSSDFGALRLIVDKPEEAKAILVRKRIQAKEGEVVVVELPDVVGALGKLSDCLAACGVNIDYLYSLSGRTTRKCPVALGTKDVQGVLHCIKKAGYAVAGINGI
jgi:hypothetical protein